MSSYLTARVLVDTPREAWIDVTIAAWERLRARAPLSWRVELRAAGETRFEERRIADAEWPALLADARAGHYGYVGLIGAHVGRDRVALTADVSVRIGLRPETALGDSLYPSLPRAVEVERHARCVTMSIESPDDATVDELKGAVDELVRTAGACWAQVSVESRIAGPFDPAMRSWGAWAPYVRRRAPEAAWLVVLGPGHVAVLGGLAAARAALARHAVVEIESPAGMYLHVEVAPTPVAADDTRVGALREALAPILLVAPTAPTIARVFAPRDDNPAVPALERGGVRRLADGALVLDTGPAARRDDLARGRAIATDLERINAYLVASGAPRGEWLYLPRLLGEVNYLRCFPSLPAIDSGEPFDDRLPLAVLVAGRRANALAAALAAMIEARVASASCRVDRDRVTCDLPRTILDGDRLLELLASIDHLTAAGAGVRGVGVVLGRIVPADEVLARVEAGQMPALQARPDDVGP